MSEVKVNKFFLERRPTGSSRLGLLAERMRRTMAKFKLCFRSCRSSEDELRAQALAGQLAGGDTVGLWRG